MAGNKKSAAKRQKKAEKKALKRQLAVRPSDSLLPLYV
jgi:hypothetical protein